MFRQFKKLQPYHLFWKQPQTFIYPECFRNEMNLPPPQFHGSSSKDISIKSLLISLTHTDHQNCKVLPNALETFYNENKILFLL